MAWDDDMPAILRALLQDYNDTPVYTDDRLATQILVTVPLLLMRVAFPNRYSVSISNGTLTPDPTGTTPRDDSFISLSCLMAAQLLVNNEVRDKTRQGIEIQDGDSRIKLGLSPESLRLMQKTFDSMFEDALYAYKTGGDAGLGQVITAPYKLFEGRGHYLGGDRSVRGGCDGYGYSGGLY